MADRILKPLRAWARRHLVTRPVIAVLFALSLAGTARASIGGEAGADPMQGFAAAIAIGAGVAGILVFLMRFTRREVATEVARRERIMRRRIRRLRKALEDHKIPCGDHHRRAHPKPEEHDVP